MDLTELIGALAAVCTTAAFLPQVLLIWRTRAVHDVSLGMYSILCGGLVLWLAYGLMIGSRPVIVANAVTLLLAGAILAMKLVWGRRTPGLPVQRAGGGSPR